VQGALQAIEEEEIEAATEIEVTQTFRMWEYFELCIHLLRIMQCVEISFESLLS